jgi:ATP-dependent RNA helicase DeaD
MQPALGRALTARGYTTLTPVQEAMLAPETAGRDLLVSAQTGSGKTVAFGISIAPTLLGDSESFAAPAEPLALVIAPTRELALQVRRELEWLYAPTGARIASCVGGMDMRQERRALEGGATIVVGTPGRLRDHITRGSLQMHALSAIVLDEADEMLDLGFREDLEFILGEAPEERRTLMFSATVSKPIAVLAKRFQRDAQRITVTGEESQHGDIDYQMMVVPPRERDNAIINSLLFYDATNTIIFCSTREAVRHLTSRLYNRGFSVVALSGELSQAERTNALQSMRDGRARVCVATDVAARGIDLPHLDLVIHADLPNNSETLLHRSGRTGRAGRKGTSILIAPFSRRRAAERLLANANLKASGISPPSAQTIDERNRQRLLEAPALSQPIEDAERATVEALIERYTPEQIAAAYLRRMVADLPAPEEISEFSATERQPRERLDNADDRPQRPREPDREFDGVWFQVSLGRKQRAEPRWLLPLICKAGGITKKDVGAIRIDDRFSTFQIATAAAGAFAANVLRNGTLERGAEIKALDASVLERAAAGNPPRPKSKSQDAEGARDKRKPKAFDGKRTDKPAFAGKAGKPARKDGVKRKPRA